MLLEALVTAAVHCNNYNWEYSPRCTAPVEEFHQTIEGFYGTLESGVEWKQTIVTPSIHLFEMEEVRWLIVNGEIVPIEYAG